MPACNATWGTFCTAHANGPHRCVRATDDTHVCICDCRARYRPTVELPPDHPPIEHAPILGKFIPKY